MSMSAYYNDNDSYCCQWLRNLAAASHITPGTIDGRSILDVRPADLAGFERVHFFAGIGGWEAALNLAGWRGPVWTASCPCQPLSCAGKRRGHADERHLWPALYALIAELRPATLLGEQVSGANGREWLAGVRADLEGIGYACGAADLCAASVGAPHIRQRLYWVAHAQDSNVRGEQQTCGERFGPVAFGDEARPERAAESSALGRLGGLGHTDEPRPQGRRIDTGEHAHQLSPWSASVPHFCLDGKWRRVPADATGSAEPVLRFMADGLADIMGPAWHPLLDALEKEVIAYAHDTATTPAEALRTLWRAARAEALRQNECAGRRRTVSEPTLLLLALCQLAGGEKPEFKLAAPALAEVQEGTLRALWGQASTEVAACPSHQRRLDGPSTGELADAVLSVPPTLYAHAEEVYAVQGLRSAGEGESDVSKAFATLEEVWQSVGDKGAARNQMAAGVECLAATNRFPLAGAVIGRTGLLRAAGNGLCVPLAARFVRAVMAPDT